MEVLSTAYEQAKWSACLGILGYCYYRYMGQREAIYMELENKSKEQLIRELTDLRQKYIQLELENQTLISSVSERSSHESCVSLNHGCLQPVNKLRKYHISELIDIPLLQQLFDSFYELTGIMHAVLDTNTNILSRTGWSDICVNFHRVCPQTECRCKQSDSFISAHLQDGPYIRYQCLNGLIDYATPIIVEGQHLATIFMGQLFNEPPDEEIFRQQAQEFGFDEGAYLEALHKVSIVPEHQIIPIMEFYSKLGQVLAHMGLERVRLIEAAEDKFLKAFHCFPVPVTISTFETGHLIDVNSAWVKTTGYEKQEALELSFVDLGAYFDLAERDLVLKEVHANGNVQNLETSCRTKSGELKTFLTSIETIYIENIPHLLSVHEDITERKWMEKTLKESEEKFSKAFRCNPDPITITDLIAGHYIDVNDAWTKSTGYERHEAVGRTAVELGIWGALFARSPMLRQIQKHGNLRNYETQYRMKSGELRNYLVSAEIINMDDKTHLLCVHNDITERKQAEESLQETNAYLENLINYANAAIIVWDQDYRIIRFNRAYERLTGYSAEEILGKPLDILFPNEQKDESMALIYRTTFGERWEAVEMQIAHVNGEVRTVLWNSATLLAADGNTVISTIAQGQDITERKNMEKTIRDSEEKFSKVFNTLPAIMTISSLSDNKLIDVNEAFSQITGYQRDEVLGRTIIGPLILNQQDGFKIRRKFGQKGNIKNIEVNFHTKYGEKRLGLLSAEPVIIDGQKCKLVAILDITDLRKMELEMTRLDRLNLVGEMAASIGHEIRNPMTTVRGYLQILREKKEYVQEIECFDLMIEELDSANLIITEFLALSKNKMVDMKLSNLNAIIRKSLSLIKANAIRLDKQIKLELKDLPDLPLDEKEIRQLIINLVNNGMESMPGSGDITIRTFIDDGYVIFAVQDQGQGIEHKLLDRLGTPFFTTKEQGTGLGLAVCYRIANRHNAKIEVDTSSAGTTFYVRFPTDLKSGIYDQDEDTPLINRF